MLRNLRHVEVRDHSRVFAVCLLAALTPSTFGWLFAHRFEQVAWRMIGMGDEKLRAVLLLSLAFFLKSVAGFSAIHLVGCCNSKQLAPVLEVSYRCLFNSNLRLQSSLSPAIIYGYNTTVTLTCELSFVSWPSYLLYYTGRLKLSFHERFMNRATKGKRMLLLLQTGATPRLPPQRQPLVPFCTLSVKQR